MKEKLPIRLFEKREQDLLNNEPGGRGNPPNWILEEERLRQHAKDIYNSFDNAIQYYDSMRKKQPDFIPLTLEVEVIEDAKAKTHKKELNKFLGVSEKTKEIALKGDDKLLVKVDSINDLESLKQKTTDYEKFKYPLSAISQVEIFTPDISFDGKEINYKLKLINFNDFETNNAVKEYVKQRLVKHNIIYKEVSYSPELIIFKLVLDSIDNVDFLNELPIYSLKKLPKYTFNETSIDEITSELKKLKYDSSIDYPIVGVMDSGIALNEMNEDWVIGREEFYIEDDINTSHGTFVSGIILYGDEMSGEQYTGLNGCKILDVPVVSQNTDEDELLDNIERVIKKYSKIKIWNLSISLNQEVDENDFSDAAIALDRIQEDYDVIICKSAGNSSSFLLNYPKDKIHIPSDSVRAIVVGSINEVSDSVGYAKKDYPAAYTRIGRGPSRIIKPELVHYGGDVHKDATGNFEYKGTPSLSIDGSTRNDCGTSFSTPKISAILAGLHHSMNEEFDALLLKALVIHSSDYGECTELDATTKLDQLGFGRPQRYQDILYGNEHEVTLILRDTISKGKFIDIMDFPFPRNLINDGFYEGQITVTLAYNPILEASQGSEYCQSNIDVKFGTYLEKVSRDIEKRHILNPIGRDITTQNILLSRLYSKRAIKSADSLFTKERMLIDFGDKYYPIKKYSIDLSELTPANKEALISSDRKWYLKIDSLFRDFAEKQARIDEIDLTMDFCVIITIKDPTQTKDIYSSVVQDLDYHNFIHRDIKVEQHIQVNNPNEDE